MMNPIRSLILALLLVITGFSGYSQVALTRSEVREEVQYLLQSYQQKIALIKSGARPDPIRDFLALFTNPYVQVIDNLSDQPPATQVTVRNYAYAIRDRYPTGVSLNYNPDAVRFGRINQDFGNQYSIAVRLYLTLRAFPAGQVYESRQLLEFTVTFNWDGQQSDNFRIAEIGHPSFKRQQVEFSLAPGGFRLTAPWVRQDERAQRLFNLSGLAELHYTLWLTPDVGLGAGVGYGHSSFGLWFDRMSPYAGRDPNMDQVHLYTRLHSLDFPIHLRYGRNLSDRIKWRSDVGFRISVRFWSDSWSAARQSNLDRQLSQVISYPEYDQDLASVFYSLQGRTGLEFLLSRNVGMYAGFTFIQGFRPVDRNADLVFGIRKYSGQYNPLWMDPETRNYNQFAGVELGLFYTLDGKE